MNEIQNQFPSTSPMHRREFLQKSSLAALAFTLPNPLGLFKDVPMGIVVHSYGARWNSKAESKKYPAFTNAIDLLEHSYQLGAGGIQVGVNNWANDFSKKMRARREKLGLYLEGSMGVPHNPGDLTKFEQDVVGAKEAGVGIIRTVCSRGRRYEAYHSQDEFDAAYKQAIASLQLAEPILKKHKIKLAVENHKDWRADELVALIKKLDSEWIGVTLDFGNSISLLEDPMKVVETLAPYSFTTHVKDMGLDEYADGFLLSEVPLGKGVNNMEMMIAVCRQHNPAITFNLEMITRDPLEIPCLTGDYWSTFTGLNGKELARTLKMVRENKFKPELPRVSQLSEEGRLGSEEQNVVDSLAYSKNTLGLK